MVNAVNRNQHFASMEAKVSCSQASVVECQLLDRNDQSPFRFLKPQERQLNFLEALQVFYCIDDTCQSLTTIQRLSSRNVVIKDQKLQGLLFKHRQLQNVIDSECNIPLFIIKEETLLDNDFQSNITTLGSNQNKMEIAFSLRNILRHIKQNKSRTQLYYMKEGSVEKASDNDTYTFQCYLGKLKQIIHDKLLTTSKEERTKQAIIEQKRRNLKRFKQQIKELEMSYEDRENETKAAVEEKMHQIDKMYQKLEDVKTNSAEEIFKCISDSDKVIASDKKLHDLKQNKLREEIQEVRNNLATQRKENFEKETILRKKKFKMATELSNWIQKYDQDMGSRQDIIEELTLEHEQDLKNLAELQDHFVDLEKQYNIVIEEKRIEDEKRERERQEMLLKNDAATVIQATWRGYSVRNQLKSRKKKKGKGGKKGKKGKK